MMPSNATLANALQRQLTELDALKDAIRENNKQQILHYYPEVEGAELENMILNHMDRNGSPTLLPVYVSKAGVLSALAQLAAADTASRVQTRGGGRR